VSEATALTISTYWACISTIADDLAAVPWRAFRKTAPTRRELDDDGRVDWLLAKQPNPEQTAFAFRQTQLSRVLGRGNAYAEVERDAAGRPVWVWPLDTDRVTPERHDGELVYRVSNWSRGDTFLLAKDVLHFRGLGDGVAGYSVLEAASRTLLSALGLDKYANETADSKAQMQLGGVLRTKKKLSEEAAARLGRDFEKRHLGRRGSVAVLEDEMEFDPHKFSSPHDVQLIQSRQFTATEIARIFKIPPHKVGLLERSTNSNIEKQAIEYVIGCLVPWAVRLEQEADVKLVGPLAMARRYTKHNLAELMRGDSAARAELVDKLIRNGVLSANDVRAMDDLNPVPFGDTYFVPAQWNTLERAAKGEPVAPGEGPKPGDPQYRPGEKSPPVERERPADAMSALAPVVGDAAARIVRREAHRLGYAAAEYKPGTPRFAEWLAGFRDDHREYVRKALRPLADAARLDPAVADVLLAAEAARAWAEFEPHAAAPPAAPADETASRWADERGKPLAARLARALHAAAALYPATA
jgi:HK97 family phage portal protein